jgi:hypothetical protein
MTQNEAVFQAVSAVFGEQLDNDGRVPETGQWSEAQKKEVYGFLMQSFKAGEWEKKSGGTDDESVMKYIPGLVNNHVRKDKRLNGDVEYVAKRPGSRQGTGDESVKAMKTLLSMTTDPEAKAAIQIEIAKRVAEIKPKVELDISKLPESLRHLVKS